MADINVSYSSLETAAAQLDAGRDNLEQQIEALNRLIKDLVGDGFVTSSASGAYHEAFQQYTTGAKQTISNLDGLANFLRKAMEAMRTTDDDLAKRLR